MDADSEVEWRFPPVPGPVDLQRVLPGWDVQPRTASRQIQAGHRLELRVALRVRYRAQKALGLSPSPTTRRRVPLGTLTYDEGITISGTVSRQPVTRGLCSQQVVPTAPSCVVSPNRRTPDGLSVPAASSTVTPSNEAVSTDGWLLSSPEEDRRGDDPPVQPDRRAATARLTASALMLVDRIAVSPSTSCQSLLLM
jgi:hypothetical protein